MLKIKAFDELTLNELYGILRLRMEVFVVEQQGIYQDLDNIDQKSVHIFAENDAGEVIGCIRVFPKTDEPGTVQLGRLVARNRRTGLGRRLMDTAEQVARDRWKAKELYLTGRNSAYGFYLKCGYHDEDPNEEIPYHKLRKTIG